MECWLVNAGFVTCGPQDYASAFTLIHAFNSLASLVSFLWTLSEVKLSIHILLTCLALPRLQAFVHSSPAWNSLPFLTVYPNPTLLSPAFFFFLN